MPRVLGVHGIGQQYGSGPELTQVWWLAMRGGLEAAGFRSLADDLRVADVRVGFFGDLFRPEGAMAAGDPPYSAADVRPGPEQELLTALYDAAVTQDSSLGVPDGAMGAGRVAVQVMLERLLRSRPFARVAQRAFIGNLRQVTAFLSDPAAKQRALERVAAEISPDTRVVIGHSLGSVVAYEFLAQSPSYNVELLVTLGSPLGIPNLVFDRLTPGPVNGVGAWPGCVGEWVNVADADDFVAMRKQLGPLFSGAGGAPRVRDELVDNGDEPHAITRYLNAQVTGAVLGSAL